MTTKNQIQNKQKVVVICPGRGTYNKDELGYLQRLHGDKLAFVDTIDSYRAAQGQIAISELDQMGNYNMRKHTAGENASALIYACALADFKAINRDKYDVVAVTGNSMGWYIALAAAGVLNEHGAIELINTMGSMMTDGIIGGQMIYPVVDENWQRDTNQEQQVLQWLAEVNQQAECDVHVSIYLGGYLVFGGNKAGLKALEKKLPPIDERYPMTLFNHAAFHTPLLNETSLKAKSILGKDLFNKPILPLIDGMGQIWQPYSSDLDKLYDYTLGTQVVAPYNFTKAIEVAIKEFAPDKLIVLGPGATLGGSIGHTLVEQKWLDITDKASFINRQKSEPFVLAMGMEAQRKLVI